jgi:hypothetical protein
MRALKPFVRPFAPWSKFTQISMAGLLIFYPWGFFIHCHNLLVSFRAREVMMPKIDSRLMKNPMF